ncbi:unnamed protein product [Linum trigynum]|uniref:TIR domain-containing protein n=1 Tax=Linum trigynum TaxID=586398 RepID=A0AAV2F664_9ROSI
MTNPTPSQSSWQSKHDVFISFRGVDVRNTFVDHLCATLRRKRIKSFRDSDVEDLGRGGNLVKKMHCGRRKTAT